MSHIDNPLKWLLAQLPTHIDPIQLETLMQRYTANKVAYARQCQIRQFERIVANYVRRNDPSKAETLARWQAKLAKLKAEQRD